MPLSPQLKDSELRRSLTDTRPRVVVTGRDQVEALQSLGRDLDPGVQVLDADLDALRSSPPPPWRWPADACADRALYLFTSGSDGHQKRVCRTQENLYHEAMNFISTASIGPTDTTLCLVPLYHSYGLGNGLLAAVGAGAPLVLLAPAHEDAQGAEVPFAAQCQQVLSLIADEDVRVLVGVSFQHDALAGYDGPGAGRLGDVRLVFSSGGHLPIDIYRRFLDRFGSPIRQIYGSTETGSITANLAPAAELRPDAVGRPLHGVSARILDPEGNPVEPGHSGMVWIRSAVLPPDGYDNRPEANRDVFVDGSYCTGDLGRVADDGTLFIVARKQTFIETGGYKVDPREVEAVLLSHAKVHEAVVLGIEQPGLGQLVKAVVVPAAPCEAGELAAYCAERMAPYKVPQQIELRQALPRSPLGKILKSELLASAAGGDAAPAHYLDMDSSWALNHLTWRRAERRAPAEGEVEIEIDAVGLNFLDVLSAMGIIPDDAPGSSAAGPRLGTECCGRITAVGPGVRDLAVGAEVVALYTGVFRSHACVPAALVAPKPPRLSAEEAAAVPCVFVTAHYALHHLARLSTGERVLIHAASGGVGLAAIQLARRVGAEIFATAGSEAKRDHVRQLGVAHVFDSRSLAYVEDIGRVTGGAGVDVVLNSLGGEHIPASLGLLRDDGRFVELGKRDYYNDYELGLRPFLRGLQLSLFDLRGMMFRRPSRVQGALREVIEMAARGEIEPGVHRVFTASAVVDAFHYMSQAKHVGKLVIAMKPPVLRVEGPREVHGGAESERLRAELEPLAPGARQGVVADRIRDAIADLLRVAPTDIRADASFKNLGMDSLATIALQKRLESLVGQPLPVTIAWSHPSVEALAAALLPRVSGERRDAAANAAGRPRSPAGAGARSASAETRPASAEGASAGAWGPAEPLAVVGMSCRFPGGASSPERFWELMVDGVDAVTEIPRARWDVDALYDDDPETPGKMRVRAGAFLDDIDRFDAHFFGISPREAKQMDPQQRLLLEVAWESLEAAGISVDELRAQVTGVFIGSNAIDFANLQHADAGRIDSYTGTGGHASILANRLSYSLDLHGPSVTVDTACSASLTAVHLACSSLRSGESSIAIAGGVNLILDPFLYLTVAKAGLLAPDGRCKAFSAAADGYGRAEGCGIVVLKRLADATAAGDPILAVIRGSALNQDGRTNGLTAPSSLSQQEVMHKALRSAGVRPAEVSLIEAHGTGTVVGDAIEYEAVSEVYGAGAASCALGSVKANIGHTEAAAGIAGLIKVILCLTHRMVPQHRFFGPLNPNIALAGTRFVISSENSPWPETDSARLAAVSSFGFGGTKAQVIVQEAPRPPARAASARAVHILPLSAHSVAALRDTAHAYRELLARVEDDGDSDGEPALADIAYTAAVRRTHHRMRTAVVGDSRAAWLAALDALVAGDDQAGGDQTVNDQALDNEALIVARADALPDGARPVFVFSGQGSQWCGMGRDLMATNAVFRERMRTCDTLFRKHASWSLLDALAAGEATTRVAQTEVAQPLILAMQVGLAAVWRSLGVTPEAVLGHSVGEIAAAHEAGVIELEDALRIAYHRGRLMQEATGLGTMAEIALPADEVSTLVTAYAGRVAVAALNGPRATVIAGEADAVEALRAECEARGVRARSLRVNYAFHSPQMEPFARRMADTIAGLQTAAPRCTLLSTVTASKCAPGDYSAAYWGRNIRQAVRFAPALDALIAAGYRAFVEIGPHPVLSAAVHDCLEHRQQRGVVVGSLSRHRPAGEEAGLLAALGTLYEHGYAVDWKALYPAGQCVPLPSYRFQRQRHWEDHQRPTLLLDAGQARVGGAPAGPHEHPLLGPCVTTTSEFGAPCRIWEARLAPDGPYATGEHRVRGAAVFPAAGFVDWTLAAAQHWYGQQPCEIELIELMAALEVATEAARVVQLITVEEGSDQFGFRFQSAADGAAAMPAWTLHARGTVRLSPADAPPGADTPDDIRARSSAHIPGAMHYQSMAAQGLYYGPTYRGVQEIWRRDGEALARLGRDGVVAAEEGRSQIHPGLLDACLQTLDAARDSATPGVTYLPVALRNLRLIGAAGDELWAHARLLPGGDNGADELVGTLRLLDSSGNVVLQVGEYRLRRMGTARRDLGDSLYQLAWETQAPPALTGAEPAAGRWLLVADRGGVAAALGERLERLGGTCALVREPDAAGVERALALAAAQDRGALRGVVVMSALDDGAPEDDADGRALLNAQGRGAAVAVQLVQGLDRAALQPRLWLVTCAAQLEGAARVNPTHASMWGLGRVIQQEHPRLGCTLVDLHRADAAELDALSAELIAPDAGERQVLLRGETRRVARLARLGADELDRVSGPTSEQVAQRWFRLEVDRPGVLDHVRLRAAHRRAPGRGEVEIEVHAAGLNFLDVLAALGVIPDDLAAADGAGPRLGCECAGRVVAVGPGVNGVEVGQRVIAIGFSTFASHAITRAELVAPMPEAMSFEAAATIPIVFATAWYALRHVARVTPGERVLIHAAAGGVGQAALQIARHLGAEVFATAGSPEKRALLRSLGVRHVTDSRSLRFADDVLAATDGEGVDVVLNSLAGPFIPKSLGLLRSWGRFVELGKRDYYEDNRLGLKPFLRHLTFALVDLRRMMVERPAQVQSLFGELMPLFSAGHLEPLMHREFPIAEAREAFRTMSQARHMGKLVLNLRRPGGAVAPARTVALREDATYLITGGLGGLGLRVAEWMAARGARHLALVGRRAPTPTQRAAVEALEARGVRVAVLEADIAEVAAVERVFDHVRVHMPALRGVVHAAGVLADAALLHLDPARLKSVMAPKIAGAWNLHRLVRDTSLDLFVLFSSTAAMLGAAGQGNYAAANAFLDALAHARRQRGLPAVSVAWGPWAEVGMAASAEVAGRLSRQGFGFIEAGPGLATLGRLQAASAPAHVAVVSVDWRRWAEAHADLRELPLFAGHVPARASAEAAPDGADDGPAEAALTPVVTRLRASRPAERRAIMYAAAQRQVARVLGLRPDDVDGKRPLKEQGVDSLMSVELRNALAATVGRSLSGTLIFEHPTVAQLADHLLETLAPALAGPAPAHATSTTADGSSTTIADRPATTTADGPAATLADGPAATVTDGPTNIDTDSPAAAADGPVPTKDEPVTFMSKTGLTSENDPSLASGPRGAESAARADSAGGPEPVAIIGMACRLPGGVRDPDTYWTLLADGADAIEEVPPERWDIDALYDPEPGKPGKIYSRRGGFLSDIDRFDAAFFGITPREAESMDPQQRLLLELSWEALEHACLPPDSLRGSSTGVFVGISAGDYADRARYPDDLTRVDPWSATGNAFSVAAGRISYALSLHGPSIAVDTACSSSLAALHLASQSLRAGESDLAICGGVNLMLTPHASIYFSRGGALAPDGRVKAFDAAADGTVRAEGCAMVVLKPLTAALRDGDRVYALIRGSAMNQDGRSNGLTAPSGPAQEAVIRQALAQAGVAPAQIDYVEAHGTGTRLGDSVEVNALASALSPGRASDRPLLLGTVKSNLGHTEAAAGAAGLIKVALALRHGQIPRSLHFREPSPLADRARGIIEVVAEHRSWIAGPDGHRRAGLSAFGFSGTNVHVILEEAPLAAPPPAGAAASAPADDGAVLLPLSARSPEALRGQVAAYADLLGGEPSAARPRLRDLAYTAGAGRSHHPYRLAVVGDSPDSLRASLDSASEHVAAIPGDPHSPEEARPLVFVMSGYGAQWAGMGRELIGQEPVFAAAIEACERALAPYSDSATSDAWTLSDVLYAADGDPRLRRGSVVQPALFAMAVALTRLWQAYGIEPGVYMGHSMGEVAAAHLAGALSLEDAARLICLRSRLLEEVQGQGAMALVELDIAAARARVGEHADEVSVAASLGPQATVVSGTPAAIAAIGERLAAAGEGFRPIRGADAAGHSPQMEPLKQRLRAELAGLRPRPLQVPMYSTVRGRYIEGEELTADYWADNLREPVLFWPAIESLYASGTRDFLEVSPHPIVVPAIERGLRTLDERGSWRVVPSLRRNQDQRVALLESLGQLYERGWLPRWQALYPEDARLVDAPTYPWQRERYWLPAPAGQAAGADLGTADVASASPRSARAPNIASDIAPEAVAYALQWRDAEPAARAADHAAGGEHWLIVGDRAGVAEALAAEVTAAGHRCTRVDASSAGDPSAADMYRDRVYAVHADGPALTTVVHLAALDHRLPADATGEQFARLSGDGLRSVLGLAQAVLALDQEGSPAPAPRIWAVTRGAQVGVSDQAEVDAAQSAIWGFGRVMAREHPALWGGLVDLDGTPAPARDEARQILAHIGADDGEDEVVWRDGRRRVARLAPAALDARDTWHATPSGTYLITGGRGAVGLHVARFLVARGARHLVLLGRSEPSAESLAVQDELEAAGARVVMARGDVTVAAEVSALLSEIDQRMPPLRGIVHLAATAAPGTIAEHDWDRYAPIFATKATAAWNLHTLTAGLDLDLFGSFLSMASIFGPARMVDWSIANTCLAGILAARRSRGLPALALTFGPWQGVGLAATWGRRTWGFPGLHAVDRERALTLLGAALTQQPEHIMVAACDWRQYAEGVRVHAREAGHERGLPLLAELVREPAPGGAEPALSALPLPARTERVAHVLRRELGAVLRMSPGRLQGDQSVLDLGMDSMMAMEAVRAIEGALGVTLLPTEIYERPTISALASYLAETITPLRDPDVGAQEPAPAPAETPAPAAADTVPVSEASGTDAEPELVPMDEQVLRVQGLDLCVCSWGPPTAATTVLCIHGNLDHGAAWELVAARLAPRGMRVIAPDLRGHGRSQHSASYAVLDLLADVDTTLRTIEVPQDSAGVILVGHSLGAALAALLATLRPERVASVVLVDPVLLAESQADVLTRMKAHLDHIARPAPPPLPDMEAVIGRLRAATPSLSETMARRMGERLTAPAGADGARRWRWDPLLLSSRHARVPMERETFTELLRTLAPPTLWVRGAGSTANRPRELEDLQRALADARHLVVPGGHNLHIEAPGPLAAAIIEHATSPSAD